ncbi:WD repeat-containing protein [Apiospora arundinis]
MARSRTCSRTLAESNSDTVTTGYPCRRLSSVSVKSKPRLKVRVASRPCLTDKKVNCPPSTENDRLDGNLLDGAYSTGDVQDEPPSRDRGNLNLDPITPATLPRVTAHPRPGLAPSYWSDTALTPRKRRTTTATSSRLRETGRAHDRFVSQREITTPLSDRFRATKEPHELSARERLTRNITGVTPDPFRLPPRRDYLALRNRRTSRSDGHHRHPGRTVLALYPSNGASDLERQVSAGSMWSVGGTAPTGGSAVDTGRGLLLESGTNAPLYRAPFASGHPRSSDENESHEGRLAHALDINRAQRVLAFDSFSTFPRCKKKSPGQHFIPKLTTTWTGTEWINDSYKSGEVLDATGLRDDYYCSVMAFCPNCDVIAVGLGNVVYGWSESSQVSLLSKSGREGQGTWVTSLSFSSESGYNSILACGRSNGTVSLLSLLDSEGADEEPPVFKPLPRFEAQHARAVASLSWRPVPTARASLNPNNPGVPVQTEDLLVGEDVGDVYYYSVEWPSPWEVAEDNWRGSMTLLACIKAHSQQVCGLAWSPDGSQFATGGNDNLCCLYNTKTIIETEPDDDDELPDIATFQWSTSSGSSVVANDIIMDRLGTRDVVNLMVPIRNSRAALMPPAGTNQQTASLSPGQDDRSQRSDIPEAVAQASIHMPIMHSRSAALKIWRHQAAVKALAFCPWRPNLLATGGGSTDKLIHFFHTASGAALATISVSAQVTSLTWSTTRRELAATFGYAVPEHSVRIAVFSWPECTMIGCVRWHGEHRALGAIAYPGGPRGLHLQEDTESGRSSSRGPRGDTATSYSRRSRKLKQDGCLVVAGSDDSVKFHEVWGMGQGS